MNRWIWCNFFYVLLLMKEMNTKKWLSFFFIIVVAFIIVVECVFTYAHCVVLFQNLLFLFNFFGFFSAERGIFTVKTALITMCAYVFKLKAIVFIISKFLKFNVVHNELKQTHHRENRQGNDIVSSVHGLVTWLYGDVSGARCLSLVALLLRWCSWFVMSWCANANCTCVCFQVHEAFSIRKQTHT